jgi:hypothetical protein
VSPIVRGFRPFSRYPRFKILFLDCPVEGVSGATTKERSARSGFLGIVQADPFFLCAFRKTVPEFSEKPHKESDLIPRDPTRSSPIEEDQVGWEWIRSVFGPGDGPAALPPK